MSYRFLAAVTGLAAVALGSPAAAEPVHDAARFPIREFHVAGNALVATDDLQLRLSSLLGEARSLDDLLAARAAVIAAYQEAGRPLVTVGLPERFGTDGKVELKVVEIPVREVRVEGNARLSADQVRARIPALVERESPPMDEIARQLALANENPSLKLSLEFSPRSDLAADATLRVEEGEPWSVAINTDNTGTPESGRWRVGVAFTDADLTGRGDMASVSYVTAPAYPERVQQFAANYVLPLPSLADSVVFFGSHSDVDVGRIGDAFEAAGQGSAVGVRYQHNLVRTLVRRQSVEAGLERRRYRNVLDFSGTDLGHEVESRPLSLGYVFSTQRGDWQWGGSVGYVRNLPGGARNDDRAYAVARHGADADWSLWRANARIGVRLPRGMSLQVLGAGQYADEPLISGEQFGVGGARSVRGFQERAVAGDRGWHLGGEFGLPRIGEWGSFVLFADRGGESRLSPLPGESAGEVLASWGLGWRYSRQRFSALVDWAHVLQGTEDNGRGHQKVHVQASVQF